MTIGAAQPGGDDNERDVPTQKLGKGLRLGAARMFAGTAADHHRIPGAPVGELRGLGWTMHAANLASEAGLSSNQ